jgi:hypothetical protein
MRYAYIMLSDIYTPFDVAYSLGSALDAPANSLVYFVKAYASDGHLDFAGVYVSYSAGLEALYLHSLESLELLDILAPWTVKIRQSLFNDTVSLKEYAALECEAKKEWLKVKSKEEVIETYYSAEDEIPYVKNWEIKKRMMG